MNRRSWWATYNPWVKESDTTERLTLSLSLLESWRGDWLSSGIIKCPEEILTIVLHNSMAAKNVNRNNFQNENSDLSFSSAAARR